MTDILGKWTFSESVPKPVMKKQLKSIKIKDKKKWGNTLYKTFVFVTKEKQR